MGRDGSTTPALHHTTQFVSHDGLAGGPLAGRDKTSTHELLWAWEPGSRKTTAPLKGKQCSVRTKSHCAGISVHAGGSTRRWARLQTSNCHSVQPMACYTLSSPHPDWEKRTTETRWPPLPEYPRPCKRIQQGKNIQRPAPSTQHPSPSINNKKPRTISRHGQDPGFLVALAAVRNRHHTHWALHLYLWPPPACRLTRAVACLLRRCPLLFQCVTRRPIATLAVVSQV